MEETPWEAVSTSRVEGQKQEAALQEPRRGTRGRLQPQPASLEGAGATARNSIQSREGRENSLLLSSMIQSHQRPHVAGPTRKPAEKGKDLV